MKFICLTLLLLLFSAFVSAQTYRGTVADESGKGLQGVSVILMNGRNSTIAFATSDKLGAFTLQTPEGKQGVVIKFTRMGYAPDTIRTEDFKDGQTVRMYEKAIALREVKVKSLRIRQYGDTLDYTVNSFKQGQDRSIADVIAHMPGMEVKENGTILYQGKAINKFYIEGMDLMGGKYAMASENLSADKVRKVQVYENHQPVRALKDVKFSEQAALNIVLKDDAKDVWQGVADLATGMALQDSGDWLYDGKMTAMLFSRRKQSVSMYKFNNTGKNIEHEISPIAAMENYVPTESHVLSNIYAGGTGLDERRTQFNNTHVAATNWLFKSHKDNDLRIQLTALCDRSLQRQETQTIYIDVSGDSIVTEVSDARSYRTEYSSEVMYKINTERLYLTNTLSGYADFNHSSGLSLLNGQEKRESVKPRRRYVTDKLQFIRNAGKTSYTASSYFSYSYLPGTLLLSNGTTQVMNLNTLIWHAATNFRHSLAGFNVTYEAGADIRYQTLTADNFLGATEDRYGEYGVFITPQIGYKTTALEMGASIPVTWRHRTLNGERESRVTAEPVVYLHLSPWTRWKFNLFYNYMWIPQDGKSMGTASLFTNYYTMRRGTGSLEHTMMHSINGSVEYKDIIRSFFANAGVSCSSTRNTIMYRNEIDTACHFYISLPTDWRTHSENLSVRASVSKGFDWWRTDIRLSGSISWRNYEVLLGNEKMPFQTRSNYLTMKLSMTPAYWISLTETSTLNYSRQINRRQPDWSVEGMRYFIHTLWLNLMPGQWQITWKNELYHSNDKTVSFNFFSDFSVSYRKKTFETGLYLNNILGNCTYERRYITDTQRVFTVNRLRPREILARIIFNL